MLLRFVIRFYMILVYFFLPLDMKNAIWSVVREASGKPITYNDGRAVKVISDKEFLSILVAGDNAEANGYLVAAAPDLLEFVKRQAGECHENYGEYPEEGESGKAPCIACQANELIAKVEGSHPSA